ncbi:MAG: response regulator [Candidatus Omnitrophota bacterium]|jgi:putative two-component system response regulator|nr:MAG: response regulator [Candidatus Omnitrophota bacterium]
MINPEQLTAGKILIIDDQPQNILLLEKMLKAAQYASVNSTTDSRRAVDLYQEYKPDLVLLDLRMPHMDGFQVMEQLREIEGNSYLPILVLTAQSDRDTRLRALESGAKDFLDKPLDQAEVLARIHNILEIRLLYNELSNQNQILEEKVRIRTKELHDTRLEVIRRLGRAAEYRDDETGEHIIRISRYCAVLARAAGMSDQECDLILHASPMHDIGKIGIPDRIMLKPGKLTPEEWITMKSHTTIGAALLCDGNSELLKTSEEIALTHHEKWDGAGYPHGLKGEEIPLFGRICALADVFDALLSERPYKKSWPLEDAVEEIKCCRENHFDPRLVDIFFEILPMILEIRRECMEKKNSHAFQEKEPSCSPNNTSFAPES